MLIHTLTHVERERLGHGRHEKLEKVDDDSTNEPCGRSSQTGGDQEQSCHAAGSQPTGSQTYEQRAEEAHEAVKQHTQVVQPPQELVDNHAAQTHRYWRRRDKRRAAWPQTQPPVVSSQPLTRRWQVTAPPSTENVAAAPRSSTTWPREHRSTAVMMESAEIHNFHRLITLIDMCALLLIPCTPRSSSTRRSSRTSWVDSESK